MLQPRRRKILSLSLIGLCSVVVLIGCFEAGEAERTPEDVAWATEDLSSVEVLDATHVLMTSLFGSIYHSADGAPFFRRVHTDPAIRLHDLSMADRKNGWAVGDGRILVTDDGGLTWRVQTFPFELAEVRL